MSNNLCWEGNWTLWVDLGRCNTLPPHWAVCVNPACTMGFSSQGVDSSVLSCWGYGSWTGESWALASWGMEFWTLVMTEMSNSIHGFIANSRTGSSDAPMTTSKMWHNSSFLLQCDRRPLQKTWRPLSRTWSHCLLLKISACRSLHIHCEPDKFDKFCQMELISVAISHIWVDTPFVCHN